MQAQQRHIHHRLVARHSAAAPDDPQATVIEDVPFAPHLALAMEMSTAANTWRVRELIQPSPHTLASWSGPTTEAP